MKRIKRFRDMMLEWALTRNYVRKAKEKELRPSDGTINMFLSSFDRTNYFERFR